MTDSLPVRLSKDEAIRRLEQEINSGITAKAIMVNRDLIKWLEEGLIEAGLIEGELRFTLTRRGRNYVRFKRAQSEAQTKLPWVE